MEFVSRLFSRNQTALLLAGSFVLPYVIYHVPSGGWRLLPFLAWCLIGYGVSFWFLIRPQWVSLGRIMDVAFLVLLAGVILSGLLRWVFPAPWPKLPAEVLGHVTLIRTGIVAVLLLRRMEGTGFGFIPGLRELAIGFFWFLAGAAVAVPLGTKLGQLHASTHASNVWQTVGLLLGTFWVVALSEEFFFRGLLQQWLSRWTRSSLAGLVLASLLFGACHLSFRGFPNWRIAILSVVLGLATGAAFWQARSIRASMVTHALAVGAWRLFLS